MKETQRIYNQILSGQIEVIERAPRMAWIAPRLPWWRLDIRIDHWMKKWDLRFMSRYADRSGLYLSQFKPPSIPKHAIALLDLERQLQNRSPL